MEKQAYVPLKVKVYRVETEFGIASPTAPSAKATMMVKGWGEDADPIVGNTADEGGDLYTFW
jgi:hypothetical protein